MVKRDKHAYCQIKEKCKSQRIFQTTGLYNGIEMRHGGNDEVRSRSAESVYGVRSRSTAESKTHV